MQHRYRIILTAVLLPVFFGLSAVTSASDGPFSSQTLFDFRQADSGGRINADGPALHQAKGRLTLAAGAGRGGSVVLKPTGDHWDIHDFTRLQFEVANPGKVTVRLRIRALNMGGNDWSRSAINDGFVHPGQHKVFNVFLWRDWGVRDQYPALKQFTGMSGLPGGLLSHWHTIDAADVKSIQIELFPAPQPQRLDVYAIKAGFPVVPTVLENAKFMPFIDKFGQYKYADWPGKIHSDAELNQAAKREGKDLAAHPTPPQWDRWGGWKQGPTLAATGAFRTEKYNGKWWLVDPDGRLFWSHGADCVGYSAGTTVTGREVFFAGLPPRTGLWASAWSQSAPDKPASFDFLAANLMRQYGPNWQAASRTLAHRRLRSWGMNTVGNWSDSAITAQDRTPYTASLWPWSPEVFPGMFDVFKTDFAANFAQGIRDGVKDTAKDPWCIGYFVHNELGWSGDPVGFMARVLAADPVTATKQEFVRSLRAAYPDIAAFNAKTGAHFADWDAVSAGRAPISLEGIKPEAETCYSLYCDRYFVAVGAAIRQYAPGRLYLGCRWNVSNPLVIRSAAKECDVLSFNQYQSDVDGFRPADVDKPALVSEFHFGDLDRGMFGTGLQSASDEQDRADKYRYYVTSALKNPYLVGTHWFAFATEPPTGRGDGENYEDGLFDICNNPYPELRTAVRDIGGTLYATRAGNPPPRSAGVLPIRSNRNDKREDSE